MNPRVRNVSRARVDLKSTSELRFDLYYRYLMLIEVGLEILTL